LGAASNVDNIWSQHTSKWNCQTKKECTSNIMFATLIIQGTTATRLLTRNHVFTST